MLERDEVSINPSTLALRRQAKLLTCCAKKLNQSIPAIQIFIQGTTPEITAAKDAVVKNPQDPNAHLQLAFAYWEAKQVRQSTDSMKEALTLAGPDNKEFLQQAAEGFKQREAWVASAAVYVHISRYRLTRSRTG